jgi:hypothetical protein
LGVHVDGAKLCEEILADLEQLDAAGEEALTLVEAAKESGYSADHLGRLVRAGDIENVGRAHAPKIRRRNLPRKPGTSLTRQPVPLSPPTVGGSRPLS